MLENHAHGLPGQTLFPVLHHRQVFSFKYDLSRSGHFQIIDAPHQGTLTRTGQADDTEHLSIPDFQIDILQGSNRTIHGLELFPQPHQLNDGIFVICFHRFNSFLLFLKHIFGVPHMPAPWPHRGSLQRSGKITAKRPHVLHGLAALNLSLLPGYLLINHNPYR